MRVDIPEAKQRGAYGRSRHPLFVNLGEGLIAPNEACSRSLRCSTNRAEVGDRRIVLEIYPVTTPEMAVPQPFTLWGIKLAPRAGVRGTLLRNPRTGEPLSVPALVLPEAYNGLPKATLARGVAP